MLNLVGDKCVKILVKGHTRAQVGSVMPLVRWLQGDSSIPRDADGATVSTNTRTSSAKEKGKLPLL